MAVDLTALRTELQNDPASLGYAALLTAGSDQGLADALNLRRASIQVRRADIAPAEIAGAIAVADYTALPGTPTAAQLSTERRFLAWLTGIMAVPTLRLLNDDGTDGPAIANFKAMFAAGTGTLTRLSALASRTGSRAEQLFGTGVGVTALDVARAFGRGL